MPMSGQQHHLPVRRDDALGHERRARVLGGGRRAGHATKPIIKPNTMRLNKLFGLVPVTDELLADSPAIGAYLTGLLGRSIKWKVNDAIMNGTGAGQPLGILNGAGLVVIAKEGGQATLTLLAGQRREDVRGDAGGLPGRRRVGDHAGPLPQLMVMTLGNFAIWTPPDAGLRERARRLPLRQADHVLADGQAFSSQGDIYFVNFKAYRTISKDGVQIASRCTSTSTPTRPPSARRSASTASRPSSSRSCRRAARRTCRPT
jgi:hypothetical protein